MPIKVQFSNDLPPELSKYSEELERYKICMQDIKLRCNKIVSYCNSIKSYDEIKFDAEFIFLQFRNICELIALAGLAAHKSDYTKGYENLKKEWRPSRIKEFIEKINPHWYPIPVDMIPQEKDSLPLIALKNKADSFLNESEFLDLYNYCSDHIHAQNPFADAKNYIQASSNFELYFKKIERLLSSHLITLKTNIPRFLVLLDFNGSFTKGNDIRFIYLTPDFPK